MLSDQQIREFQKLYQQEFGEPIDQGKARVIATQLVDLVRAIYQPYKPGYDQKDEKLQLKHPVKNLA